MIGKDQKPDIGKATQWKKGDPSPNPSGKPKGTKHLSTYIREMMTDPNFTQKLKDGTEVKGAPIEAILKTAIAQSMSGDKAARDYLAKYGWGTKIDITTDGEKLEGLIVIKDKDNEDPPKQVADKGN